MNKPLPPSSSLLSSLPPEFLAGLFGKGRTTTLDG